MLSRIIEIVFSIEYFFYRRLSERNRKNTVSYINTSHVKAIANEIEPDFAYLCQTSPFRGLISETFNPNDFYPSPKDIAVAIGVSAETFGEGYSTDKIIGFSHSFVEELKRRIISDPRLKKMFSYLRKEVGRLSLACDKDDIEATLGDQKAMFTYYFI